MAIIRHEQRNNFTVIPNRLIRDENISLQDMGLLVYMLSLPDDWNFSTAGLAQVIENNGKDALRSSLVKLEKAGYLKRERRRGADGRLYNAVWQVADIPDYAECEAFTEGEKKTAEAPAALLPEPQMPVPAEPKQGEPMSEEPISEEPTPEKPMLVKPTQENRTETKKQYNKETIMGASQDAREKRIFRKPSPEEVRAYAESMHYSMDCEAFVNYHEANGWRIGKNPMKDWKAAVRYWYCRGRNDCGRETPPRRENEEMVLVTGKDGLREWMLKEKSV